MSDERREHPRYPASLAGEIETAAGRASVAITHDVSTSGLLLLSLSQLAIDAPVTLRVKFRQTEVKLTGKVVRLEEVDPNHRTLWRYQVALVIDPSPAFDQLTAELAVVAPESP